MDSHRFFNFITILKESIKLLGKNTKLMALVTSLSMISYSIFFSIFSSSSNFFFLHDMIVKESMVPIFTSVVFKFVGDATKTTSDGLPTAFVPLYFIITFFSTTAAITVSSQSLNGDSSLTLTDLSTSVVKSSVRPLVTAFYVTVSVAGFECLALYVAIPLLASSLDSSNVAARAAAVAYGVAAAGLYMHVCGVWIMALVVSVVEEGGGGVAAFGKSAEMMKGRRLDAFLLNFLFSFLVYFFVLIGWILMNFGDHGKIWGLFLVNFCCLIRVLNSVAYTVFYFRGKEELGQDVELEYANLEVAGIRSDGILFTQIRIVITYASQNYVILF